MAESRHERKSKKEKASSVFLTTLANQPSPDAQVCKSSSHTRLLTQPPLLNSPSINTPPPTPQETHTTHPSSPTTRSTHPNTPLPHHLILTSPF
ncbi:hypothetical protein E2C01_025583 [Portunus trituberculatus]|uniref:Uncharacterized protein n=1 Tax=Portunus trituberculatus TaxID=210409 RepID=A0A5B7EIB4_PORTR|nr:hypothetical protein [Portunus trituberculatus]